MVCGASIAVAKPRTKRKSQYDPVVKRGPFWLICIQFAKCKLMLFMIKI